MPQPSHPSRSLAFARSALLLPAALVLGGCAFTDPGERTTAPLTADAGAPEASASADPGDGLETPEDLTFEAGAVLGPRLRAQWGDSLVADADYTLTTPDDGNGNWAYTQNSTQCEVRFWQGDVSSIGSGEGDRALSDAVLATWLKVSPDEVTAAAQDDMVGYVPGTSGSTQVRVVAGSTQSGGSWVAAARGLTSFHGGFVVHVTCPEGQSAQSLYSTLRDDKLTLVVGPGL